MASRVAWVLGTTVVLASVLAISAAAKGPDKKGPNKPPVQDVHVGKHISGAVKHKPGKPPKGGSSTAPVQCSKPGGTNFRTDCNSSGRPVNETWVTYGNGTYYAGANDYNSYNGQGQDGFYWSSDGVNWNDAGPLDVFPHNNSNGAGDPGLAVDGNGVVYYSSLFFNFNRCNIGGVELMRRDPSNGSWSRYQIAANSSGQFQDKPAIAVGSSHVYVSWTQFGSCSGSNVPSPIKVAVLPTGTASAAPTATLSVPGSTYSQGSSIASDGNGGFWIAWEEYPSASATTGSIMLAHYDGSKWSTPQTISPSGFKDLPSPLPGFAFRTDSFPALTVVNGQPEVAWTSYDSGVGRAYLWDGSSITELSNSGGDQFFPSIAHDASGGIYVAYSQTDRSAGTYDQYLWHGGTAQRVSIASSDPSQDLFFSGQFIGDYNGMVVTGSGPHPIWTDISSPDLNYGGNQMDSMFYSAASAPPPPPSGSISFVPSGSQTLTAGVSAPMQVQLSAAAGTGGVAVTLSSTSPKGTFSSGSSGPSNPLTVTVAQGSTTADFTYTDTKAGSPTLTASATGYSSATQTDTVQAAALASITVAPSSASVPEGGTQVFTASGADQYGNTVDVSGATWSTDVPGGQVSPQTGASTTLTAGSTAGTGYSVTATVGSVSGGAKVDVIASASFAVSASPGTATVKRGHTVTYQVAITSTGSPSVTLSASNVPKNTTASFSPNPATSSSTLTVSTSHHTHPGTYTLTITGTSGSATDQTTVTLIVTK